MIAGFSPRNGEDGPAEGAGITHDRLRNGAVIFRLDGSAHRVYNAVSINAVTAQDVTEAPGITLNLSRDSYACILGEDSPYFLCGRISHDISSRDDLVEG